MKLFIHADAAQLGRAAAAQTGDLIAAAIRERGEARIVIATGASQFEMLANLVQRKDIDWSRVDCFHLDEYIGIGPDHPASFRRYLRERFVSKVSGLRSFHGVDGDAADPQAECRRLGGILASGPIDVLCLGIGENGHLAFNDPPADFTTREPYLVVTLDEACRKQQLGEGWFPDLQAVPRQAISMSIGCILSARVLVASVPDERKARAVRDSLEAPISPLHPGTALRKHGQCNLHIDRAAASLVDQATIQRLSSGA